MLDINESELFNLATTGMIVLSPEGIILKVNPACSALLGDTQNFQNLHFSDLFDSKPSLDIAAWHTKTLHGEPVPFRFELNINPGTEPAKQVIATLNLIRGEGSEKGILCQVKQVHETAEPHTRVIYQNHLLTELINHIPDSIFIKDTQSRFILANVAVAKLMGVNSPGDLMGRTDFDFHPKKLAAKYRRDEEEIIAGGEARMNIVEQVIDPRHLRRWYSTSKIPLTNTEGKIIGIMGVGREITQYVKKQKALRKAKHEAEKADKLKTAFLANLSHEVRTPLNGILGFSQFLRQLIEPDSKGHKYIDFIVQNGKLLLHLISDIIDISKIDAGQLMINKKNFALNELFRQLEITVREVLNEKEKDTISLHLEIDLADEDSIIYNDDLRLKQVLHNLLMNAVKFTEQGSIVFGYRFEKSAVHFYVKDTGIGIAPENLSIIFDRFTQVDHSLKRQYEGTGIGLSIARGLVHLLDGRIEVKSELSRGSEFSFTIPIEGKHRRIRQKYRSAKKSHGPMHIYILGKDPELNRIFSDSAFKQKISITEFDDTRELHNFLKTATRLPELVVCHPGNRQSDIAGLIDAIKDILPEVPILAVVSHTRNLLTEECLAAGAKDFITEPVNAILLTEKIKLLVGK